MIFYNVTKLIIAITVEECPAYVFKSKLAI